MKSSKTIALFFSLLMVGSGLGVLVSVLPTSSASAPSSSISNSVYLNGTLSGDQNFGTINSGHVVLNSKSSVKTLDLYNTGSFTESNYQFTWTDSLGSLTYSAGTSVTLPVFGQVPIVQEAPNTEYYQALGSIQATVSLGGSNYAMNTYTPDYQSGPYSSSPSAMYWQYNGAVTPSASTGVYTVTLTIVISVGSQYDKFSLSGGVYSDSTSTNDIQSNSPLPVTENFMTGYTFSGASVATPTLSVPSNLVSWDIVNSNVPSGVSASASGIQTSNFATSIKFTGSSSTSLSSTSYTIDYATENAIESESQSFSSGPLSMSITQHTNWWNSTISYSASPPSSWINGNTVDGKTWSTTLTTYSVSHILSAGYGTSPAVDIMEISGSHSATYNFPSQYESFTVNPSSTENSAFTLSFNIAEFINYRPSIVSSNIATPVNPLTPISLYANATEAISGEQQNLAVSLNGRPSIYSPPTLSESLASPSFYFHSTGQKRVNWYVHNSPNGNPYPGSELNSSIQTATVNVLPFSLTPSPVDYSSVGTSVLLSLAYSTQTSAKMTIINLTVNGVLENRFQPDASSGSVKYDFTQPVSAPLLVTWTATDQYGYSQSITFQYGSNLTPAEYSNKVTVLQSPNATHSYPITLSGVPNGTGFYQQLLTIGNSTNPISKYGINSAGSNIQFAASNGTMLYAWEQSVNSSAIQVTEFPVNEGEAVPDDGVNEPDDAPDSEGTSWFCAKV